MKALRGTQKIYKLSSYLFKPQLLVFQTVKSLTNFIQQEENVEKFLGLFGSLLVFYFGKYLWYSQTIILFIKKLLQEKKLADKFCDDVVWVKIKFDYLNIKSVKCINKNFDVTDES